MYIIFFQDTRWRREEQLKAKRDMQQAAPSPTPLENDGSIDVAAPSFCQLATTPTLQICRTHSPGSSACYSGLWSTFESMETGRSAVSRGHAVTWSDINTHAGATAHAADADADAFTRRRPVLSCRVTGRRAPSLTSCRMSCTAAAAVTEAPWIASMADIRSKQFATGNLRGFAANSSK